MKTLLALVLMVPFSGLAQMMPERLAKHPEASTVSTREAGKPSSSATDSLKRGMADTSEPVVMEQATPASPTQLPAKGGIAPLTSFEFWLSIIILAFTLIFILTEVWLIRSNLLAPESALRAILVTLIIGATLFLITAGYSNDQIAPAMGLFGTIAGYLLGRNMGKEKGGE